MMVGRSSRERMEESEKKKKKKKRYHRTINPSAGCTSQST
jgi:hypothetical protein